MTGTGQIKINELSPKGTVRYRGERTRGRKSKVSLRKREKVEWRTDKKGRVISDPALVPRAIE
jgi:hypothetical protein